MSGEGLIKDARDSKERPVLGGGLEVVCGDRGPGVVEVRERCAFDDELVKEDGGISGVFLCEVKQVKGCKHGARRVQQGRFSLDG